MKKNNFHIAHFPVGTIVEAAELPTRNRETENAQYRITGIVSNGPNSWVLLTDTPGTVTEFLNFNMQWVTRIVERGKGKLLVDSGTEGFSKSKHGLAVYESFMDNRSKPKSKYRFIESLWILQECGSSFVKDTMCVDYHSMVEYAISVGVIKLIRFEDSHLCFYHEANKKNLKKFIKQNINKFLVKRELAQKNLYKMYEDDFRSDMEELLDGKSQPYPHRVMNEHGFYDYLDEQEKPVCSQCGCCMPVNMDNGTVCSECNHKFTVECEHDMYGEN